MKLRELFKPKVFNRAPSPCWQYGASVYPCRGEHVTIYRDDVLKVQCQVHEKYGSSGYRLQGIYYFIDDKPEVYRSEAKLMEMIR